jgi:hypothetical protein
MASLKSDPDVSGFNSINDYGTVTPIKMTPHYQKQILQFGPQ